MLVICTVLMCWAPGRTLKDRFAKARETTVGMYPARRQPGKSYPGFRAALLRSSARLLAVGGPALRRKVQQIAGAAWCVEGRLVFGVDGSRIDCPMTAANETSFGCAGKKKTVLQQLVTTLFHMGTGFILAWRRRDSRSSERTHLQEMLDLLPRGAMLLADAGYAGCRMLGQLLERRMDFVIRVGSHVQLLMNLGYARQAGDGLVYLWPSREQKKGLAPLVLRLIVLSDERNRRVYLLTNVLDGEDLSDAQVGRLYRLRRGVELLCRALKQTLEHRKMLSDSPKHTAVELDWAMVGLWILGLISLEAVRQEGHPLQTRSVAGSLRVVRWAMDQCGKSCRHGSLRQMLGRCVQDKYQRHSSKKACHPNNKKTERPPGAPKLRTAEESKVLLAQQLRKKSPAA